jgi:site-specific DNA-methyltransferase (adenine-specific)/adenine-specific DNA-methyltransferase
MSESKFWKTDSEGKVWWGEDENNNPRIKEYLTDAKAGVVPATWWTHQYAGTNSGAKVQLRQMLGNEQMFITPKPIELVQRILELASGANTLVLDSFAGSATTGHAVLKQNQVDGGMRRFILVEIEPEVATAVAAERLKRAIDGFSYKTPKGKMVEVKGLGGGFHFCNLGEPLFDEAGSICGAVRFPELASHVYFTETGTPIPKRATGKNALLGEHNGKAIYLLFNGVLGDKSTSGGNVLTNEILRGLPEPTTKDGTRVIYGEGCRLGAARLKREGIVFRQVPYEIKVS